MQENDFGAGFTLVRLVAGSLAVGILAIVLRSLIARQGHRLRPAIGSRAGCAPHLAGFTGGVVGFLFVVFLPRFFVVPAGLFAAFAFGVLLRRGAYAAVRAFLLVALAILWLGLVPYGERMNRWSETVMGAIRVDALITAAMAAAWAFLGVWLWRQPDRQEVVEEVEDPADPEGPITAGIRRR